MPRIHDLGAELIFISTGSSHFARAFRQDFSVTVPILLDPSRQSYQLLGMVRGLSATFSGKTVVAGRRALKAGFRQGRTQGDPWQQGGVLVIRPDGSVPYRYLSSGAGDHPPPQEVIAALEEHTSAARS
ncbi:MAG: hypothetical protein ACI8RZ_007841 [Myxococcota bacterium]